MIKAVLFDFFGVLTEGDATLRQVFAEAYGISPERVRTDPSQPQALKGQIADGDFIAAMNRQNPDMPPASTGRFEARAGYPVLCTPVYELAEALRAHGVKTGILSNTLRTSADSLRQHGMYDGFDPVLLSCDANLMKPDGTFYQLAVARLGVEPHEIAMVDDTQANLDTAAGMGLHTILAQNPEQIVRDVKELIRQENGVEL